MDDEEKLRFILRAHLSAAGFEVHEAQNAEQAIAEVKSFRPDLIVMDVGLPGMDGIEGTRRLKADPETSAIPIIMLTARSASDHVVMALEAGAQEYVVKPFDVGELMARIRTVLRLARTRTELDALNNRLATEVEQRTARLRTLYNFTRALNEADSIDAILGLIIEAVTKVTGCQRASILLKDDEGEHLICRRATGIEAAVAGRIRVHANDGIAGKVFTTGKTYVAKVCSGVDDRGYDGESFISTPLIATSLTASEERLGVLSITDRNGGQTFEADEIECVRSIADSGAIAIHNQLGRERLEGSVKVLLMTVGRLAEYRDNETSLHLERVCEYARILTTELHRDSKYAGEIGDGMIEDIYLAAPMHDIGKVGIADDILCKPGKLTDDEYGVMQRHCAIGREVLEPAMARTGPVPLLKMCVEIASSHHERWDGNGYPEGLAGEDIPLAARIIALVDAYDAITSRRRYKEAASHEKAVRIIQEDAGKHFDPHLIEPFLRCADAFNEVRRTHEDDTSSPSRHELASV